MISKESVPFIEETRDADLEDYFDMPVAGAYLNPYDTDNPVYGEHLVTSSVNLLEKHLELKEALQQFRFEDEDKAIYERLSTGFTQQAKAVADSDDLKNEVRALTHAHENMHRDQEIRLKAANKLINFHAALSQEIEDAEDPYHPNLYYKAGLVYSALTYQELQSTLAQYNTNSYREIPSIGIPANSNVSLEAKLYCLQVDALYVSSLLGRPEGASEDPIDTVVNAIKLYGPAAGNAVGFYPQLLSKLMMFAGRERLFEDIQSGGLSAPILKSELRDGLKNFLDNPQETLKMLVTREKLLEADQLLSGRIQLIDENSK